MTATRMGLDPECRFVRQSQHLCINAHADPVRPGQPCHAECVAQIAEQGRVFRAAERAVQ